MLGGAGAHGGCYDLLSFDGEVLRPEVSHQHSSPGAGWLEDLNADGILEVILDQTDNYVFCYACGLRYPDYQVLRWDGEQLIEVGFSEFGQEVPADLRIPNNRAIALARAGLWKDARSDVGEALRADIQDPELAATVAWNRALIDLQASAMAEQASAGIYPLLEGAFYGDYDAAVETMRPFSMQEIWGPETPLIAGTAAEGWEFELTEWISRTTNLALKEEPDLAPALFLRGWGAHLKHPGTPQTIADVERASELVPDDPLYSASAAHLQVPISIAPPAETRSFHPLPPDACYGLGQALMQTLAMTVTLAEAPFDDPLRGLSGVGCQSNVTGTGADFDSQATVAAQVKAMLDGQGWTEDVMYAADGPTETVAGFQRNGALCLFSAGWSPAEDAACPTGQPISACELAPEQQLYTILLNCAQEDVPGTPMVLLPVASETPAPSETPVPSATPKQSVTPQPSDTPPPVAKERWVVRSLLAGPGEPGRLYALKVDEPSGAWPSTGARILVSDDYGETWDLFPGGLPAGDCVHNINLDYAAPTGAGPRDALYASTCQGLFRWTGSQWESLSPQETGMVAVVYGQPEVVWATEPFASGGAVIRSDDSGVTWTPASSGLISFNGVANLGIDPRNANTLYAIIWPKYAGSYLRRGTADGQWVVMPTPRGDSVIDTGMTIDGATGALYVVVTAPNAQLWRTTNPDAAEVHDVRWEMVHDFGRDVQVSLLASGWSPDGLALYANVWPLEWKDASFAEVGEPTVHRSLDGGQSWLPLPVR
jgi:hypothetical protein